MAMGLEPSAWPLIVPARGLSLIGEVVEISIPARPRRARRQWCQALADGDGKVLEVGCPFDCAIVGMQSSGWRGQVTAFIGGCEFITLPRGRSRQGPSTLIALGGVSVHLCAPKGLLPKSVRENRTVQSS